MCEGHSNENYYRSQPQTIRIFVFFRIKLLQVNRGLHCRANYASLTTSRGFLSSRHELGCLNEMHH